MARKRSREALKKRNKKRKFLKKKKRLLSSNPPEVERMHQGACMPAQKYLNSKGFFYGKKVCFLKKRPFLTKKSHFFYKKTSVKRSFLKKGRQKSDGFFWFSKKAFFLEKSPFYFRAGEAKKGLHLSLSTCFRGFLKNF